MGIGYSAAQKLIQAGHRHIIVLLPRDNEVPFYRKDRYHGCLLAAHELGKGTIKISPIMISLRRKKPLKTALPLLNKSNPKRATALFATSVNVLLALRPSLAEAEILRTIAPCLN